MRYYKLNSMLNASCKILLQVTFELGTSVGRRWWDTSYRENARLCHRESSRGRRGQAESPHSAQRQASTPTRVGGVVMSRGGSGKQEKPEKEGLIHHPASDRFKTVTDLGINLTKDSADPTQNTNIAAEGDLPGLDYDVTPLRPDLQVWGTRVRGQNSSWLLLGVGDLKSC